MKVSTPSALQATTGTKKGWPCSFCPWLAVLIALGPVRIALADDYFDPAALEFSSEQQKTADLHYFSRQGGELPGTYHITILVNGNVYDSRDITFVEGRHGLVPLLTVRQLAEMGVNISAFPAFHHLKKGETVQELGDFIRGASTRFDFSHLQLLISIPQIALMLKSRGYIDPAHWDEGVPAAFVDYALSGTRSRNKGGDWQSTLLSLRSGMNLGTWRLRNISSYRYDLTSHWQSQTVFLERDIKGLKSQFRMGDTYTAGEVFDSVQFRGAQLMSDDEMLPDSQRGFAPVIHGIAHSNARITVSQHGYVIYETQVAPGAFVIRDLYPTTQSGDLEVTINESDGTERKFIQPYSATPFMVRQGYKKYSVSAGRYRYAGGSQLRAPVFMQSTLFYGLPRDFTVFGGAQVAQNYHAAAAGLGKGFGDFGSVGVNISRAKTDLPRGRHSVGQSVRMQYQKSIASTNTTFSMDSYRYSSGGFYSFSEANALRDPTYFVNNKRSRSEVSVSQEFGDYGSLSLTAYMQTYWRTGIKERTLHLGYYSTFQGISWGVGYFYSDATNSPKADRAISFNLTIPFSALLPDSSVSYSMNAGNDGDISQQVALSGSMQENSNLYYSLQQGHNRQGQNVNSNASLNYRGSRGNASMDIGHDKHSSQFSYALAGGIVAHAHGITLSQPLGDTFGIVRVPGASDVTIQSGSDVSTDRRGYAVIPSLTPYHKNSIELAADTLPDNVDVELAGQTAIPTSGAVVMIDYATHIGNRVLFTLAYQGATPPFGAAAKVELPDRGKKSASSGIIAENGQLYLSGVPEKGTINVAWREDGIAKSCRAPFQLAQGISASPIKFISVICQ
ncbi:fimbria/pilus outer membrane usher protein [Pantoea piersonii]|uniref:fimbria/pilus outer membrane usher protein n=3 Tax=Pantoea TaxID=53335 RepID=UPI002FDB9269